jgi:phosphoribosylanthranilate isomerase
MSELDIPFLVKICGITNEEDARAAVHAGANALGFNFYARSPRYIDLERARAIAECVPAGVLSVGVFVNASEEDLIEASSEVPLDVLQVHGEFPPLHLAASFRVWRAIQASAPPAFLDPHIEAHLLDSTTAQYGGSGTTFDWMLAAAFPLRKIVAGGLDAANVAEAIRVARPWGVDASSRLESEPGKKDPVRVAQFVQAALTAFRQPQKVST